MGNVPIQNLFTIQEYMAFIDGTVSQLLVELSRTLKGQNRVEFDSQSILQHYGSFSHKNAGLLGVFPQSLSLTNNKYFFKRDVHLRLHCGGRVEGATAAEESRNPCFLYWILLHARQHWSLNG